MLSHLSLSVCLLTISVQPPAVQPVPPVPVPGPAIAGPEGGPPPAAFGNLAGGFGPANGMGPYQGTNCPQCEHRHNHKPTPFHDWACPSCNLTQRYPYYPTDHGHYYFRPYHMQRVIEQQAVAVNWGEDPRNPHGQLVFERVYNQIRAEQAAKAEPLPAPAVNPMAQPDEMPPAVPMAPVPMPPKAIPEVDPMLPKPAPAAPNEGAKRKVPLTRPVSVSEHPLNSLRR